MFDSATTKKVCMRHNLTRNALLDKKKCLWFISQSSYVVPVFSTIGILKNLSSARLVLGSHSCMVSVLA